MLLQTLMLSNQLDKSERTNVSHFFLLLLPSYRRKCVTIVQMSRLFELMSRRLNWVHGMMGSEWQSMTKHFTVTNRQFFSLFGTCFHVRNMILVHLFSLFPFKIIHNPSLMRKRANFKPLINHYKQRKDRH